MSKETATVNPWYLKGFRKAKRASTLWNLTKTLTHTAIFWSIFLYFIPYSMSRFEQEVLGWSPPPSPFDGKVAIVCFVLAGALGLWSGITMAIIGQGTPLPLDHPNELVVRGPYRHVRNPMAIAGLAQGLFAGVFFGSWLSIPYVIAGGLLWHIAARPPEEEHLVRDFGERYLSYRDNVRCWIPRLTPYRPEKKEV